MHNLYCAVIVVDLTAKTRELIDFRVGLRVLHVCLCPKTDIL